MSGERRAHDFKSGWHLPLPWLHALRITDHFNAQA
jgi:hypothetical protein